MTEGNSDNLVQFTPRPSDPDAPWRMLSDDTPRASQEEEINPQEAQGKKWTKAYQTQWEYGNHIHYGKLATFGLLAAELLFLGAQLSNKIYYDGIGIGPFASKGTSIVEVASVQPLPSETQPTLNTSRRVLLEKRIQSLRQVLDERLKVSIIREGIFDEILSLSDDELMQGIVASGNFASIRGYGFWRIPTETSPNGLSLNLSYRSIGNETAEQPDRIEIGLYLTNYDLSPEIQRFIDPETNQLVSDSRNVVQLAETLFFLPGNMQYAAIVQEPSNPQSPASMVYGRSIETDPYADLYEVELQRNGYVSLFISRPPFTKRSDS